MRKFLFIIASIVLLSGLMGHLAASYFLVKLWGNQFLAGVAYVVILYLFVRLSDLCLDRVIGEAGADFEPLLPRRQWRPHLSVFHRRKLRTFSAEAHPDTPSD